jgi:hypothetical protein
VSAGCLRPDLLPTAMKLLIPDPAPARAESPPVKRGLLYPVQVSLAAAGACSPPPPPTQPDQGRRRHWRRRHRSPSTRLPASGPAISASGAAPRVPVHARLGPIPRQQACPSSTPVCRPSSAIDGAQKVVVGSVLSATSPVPKETSSLRLDGSEGDRCCALDEGDAISPFQPVAAQPLPISRSVPKPEEASRRLFHLGWRMGHTCPRWSGLRMGLPPSLRFRSPPRQLPTFIQPAASHRCPALHLVFRD